MISEILDSFAKEGPLSTFRTTSAALQDRLRKAPRLKRLLVLLSNWVLWRISHTLDIRFDRKYGTDTRGFVPLQGLTIDSGNVNEGIWYEPMSVKIFREIMSHLDVDFSRFDFIDFGSGKGRVLLLASDYGFRRVIGVEFAQELHRTAANNAAIYQRYNRKASPIETVCIDATLFPIPEVPLIAFFYSPFKGRVMERVLENISGSFEQNRRKIILVFYGKNSESIELLKGTDFSWEELDLRPDWSRCQQYRTFVFTSAA